MMFTSKIGGRLLSGRLLQRNVHRFCFYTTKKFEDKVTSEVKNKIAGCLPDSREIIFRKYINKVEKEQSKATGIQANMTR